MPNVDEYVYENPFNSFGFPQVYTEFMAFFQKLTKCFIQTLVLNVFFFYFHSKNKKKITLTDESKYNPIHTVPAPNLNKNLAYSTHAEFIPDPISHMMDNQIFEQKDHFNQITFRPLTVSSP